MKLEVHLYTSLPLIYIWRYSTRNISFLLGGRSQLHKLKHGKRELGAILFDIPYVGYRVYQFL
jgi:hypothetical protein